MGEGLAAKPSSRYQNDSNSKTIVTDPVHFPLIRKIFDLMLLLRALTAARCEKCASDAPVNTKCS
jgi:hypothetical protein